MLLVGNQTKGCTTSMALHIIDVAPKGGEVMASTSTVRASGTAPDHRKLNGPQTTGREYRSLSEPEYGMRRDDDVPVPMRDGVRLLTDVHRPDSDGRFPAMNVPLHLPGTFTALRALADRTTVRVGMLGKFGLTWPWESLHLEALALVRPLAQGPRHRHSRRTADPLLDARRRPVAYGHRLATTWCTPPRLALRADGGLSDDEGTLGQRSYRCLGTGLNHAPADPAAKPPSQLTWTSAPLDTDVDMVLASDDQSKGAPAIMEFRHAPVGTSTTNTISSASRLLFPVLDESDGGLDA